MNARATRAPARRGVVLLLCTVGAVAVLVFCLTLRWSLRTAFSLRASAYPEPAPAGFAFRCTQTSTPGAVVLQGWACVKGERFLTVDTRAVLYCAATGEYLRLPTGMQQTDEPTALLADGINYSFGGFYAFVRTKQLAQPLREYELCFAYRSSGHNALVHTGQFLDEAVAAA